MTKDFGKGRLNMKIFISHSSNEASMAVELCNALESGGNKCFIAPRDIRSGFEYAEEIANGIDSADIILLLLSEASNNSPHVLREIERAVTKSIPILVYKVEEVALTKSMEYFLMTHQWMEAGKDSYEDVVKCVNDMENPASTTVPSAKSANVQSAESNRDSKSNQGNKKTGVAVIAAVAVLAVVVACVVLFAQTGKKDQGSTDALAENVVAPEDIKLGDTIVCGSYNGEDIYWRVLKISEDGTEAVVVARDVLTVKAFDAPDSGCYNDDGTVNYSFSDEKAKLETDMELQAYVCGNSSWETSNIRTWLNSASENVVYEGQAPTSAAMADRTNGYNTEKGFLCSFTEEELALIKETSVETKGNALSEKDIIVTQDKVFLLSLDELAWFEAADVSMIAVPTAAAIENNKNSWYNDYCVGYGVDATMWWLREPAEDSASKCYLVGNGYYEENIYTWEVGVESYGIRPAMTIDLTGESIRVENE